MNEVKVGDRITAQPVVTLLTIQNTKYKKYTSTIMTYKYTKTLLAKRRCWW